ncbi:hypothetical protein [Mesorhizobium sp.]|uniref:hypothetical protein n=1 Tax=Mesorhizobium sp. TaxID=1871066 RepID=UPI0025ECD0F8|nr:hypothetical protein [Mesorhizobium sp.]
MKMANSGIEAAVEVFVHGFSADRSRTFDVAAQEADAIVRQHARPGFAISVVIAHEDPDGPTRTAYKALGYRLLGPKAFLSTDCVGFPARRRLLRSNACRQPNGRRSWETSSAGSRSRTICSATARHSVSMWQSMASISLGAYAALMPWEPHGVRACMSSRRTGVAALARL